MWYVSIGFVVGATATAFVGDEVVAAHPMSTEASNDSKHVCIRKL